jgi:nicotinate-nucleotide pyrophosphorylase (carboxylating)
MVITALDAIIKHALSEDLCEDFGAGFTALIEGKKPKLRDVTSDALLGDEGAETGEVCRAQVTAKSDGILSGSTPFQRVFQILDPTLRVNIIIKDGDSFSKGDTIANLKGRLRTILAGERTALNFLGHLSGIATTVQEYVRALSDERIRILDTRKTIPGMRALEKHAVVHGGGMNHRMGLFDMILIKDNHIDRLSSIEEAVRRARATHAKTYLVEVETRTLDEVKRAVGAEVDRIMLDNMSIEMIKEAVRIIDGRAEIEVSGNIDLEKASQLRSLPIDFISVGSITNAAGHADFSLIVQSP